MNRNDSIQINILRFPLMVGVVFIHAHTLAGLPGASAQVSQQEPLAMFIELMVVGLWARLATPLFFLFSGYLLYRGRELDQSLWLSKLRDRASRFGLAYLCWNTAVFALFFAGQSIPQLHPYFTRPEYDISTLDGWQRVNLILGLTRFPIAYQFWFIRDLIVLVAVSPLLWLAVKYARIPTIGVLLLVWSGMFGDVAHPNAIRACLYFTLGLTLAQISDVNLRIPKHGAFVAAFVLLTTIEMALQTVLPLEEYHDALLLMSKANILVGVCAAWTCASWIRPHAGAVRVFTFLKAYAFYTFAAHEPLLTTLKKVGYTSLGHDTSASLLAVYFGASIITVLTCIAGGVFLHRYLPAVFNVLTGGRSVANSRESASQTVVTSAAPANGFATQVAAGQDDANLLPRSASTAH